MPWVRFTRNFDWRPVPTLTRAFLAGQERNVPRRCADKAVKAGAAVRIKVERKDDAGQGKV